jgi:SAM-dependent methyltransferase
VKQLLRLLREPGMDGLDVDSGARLACHKAILERKRMIRQVFDEFHALFRQLENRYLDGKGIAIELGAGVAPMRDTFPDVLSTDIVLASHLDFVMDAQKMALAADSVRVAYAQNSFHHFPDPERFLSELERVLVFGGGAIILEPYYGPVATFIYRRLFRTEGFDKEFPTWETPSSGPMNGANQALSYIVFVRDRAKLAARFPLLQLVHREPVGNYLRYLSSGGLNFRQVVPDFATRLLRMIEWAVSPCNRWLALHHVLVLKKIDR